MSKEHFNGTSSPLSNIGLVMALCPMTALLFFGAYLSFQTKENVPVSGKWGLKSMGIAILLISILEMVGRIERLKKTEEPPPSPGTSSKPNNIYVILVIMIALGLGGGYMAKDRF